MEVDRIDAAALVEELAEIYSTPTPKGWPELKKVSKLYLIDCVSFTIAEVQYLYPGPTHDSYLSTTHHNFCPKRKYSEFKITWTLIFPFLQSPTCFVPAPIIAFVVICWRYLKKADPSVAFESADTNLHAIDPFMT